MRTDKIVQFVCFETALNNEQFITQWERYLLSNNSDSDVTLQESEKKNVFKYIAQHRCDSDEFQFVFAKASKLSRAPEVEVKVRQMGGYSMLQSEKNTDAGANESKVFAFITHANIDLNVFKERTGDSKLNIYEPYYENCQYAYILEFFVRNKHVHDLLEQLKQFDVSEVGVYKECLLKVA